MAECSQAINPPGKTYRLLKLLYGLTGTPLLFIDQPQPFVQSRSVWPRFQFPVDNVEGPIILAGIVEVLGHAGASNERQESIEFLLFTFSFGHAVHSQQVKRVPVVYQLWVEFARPRVFTLSPGKIPIVPVSDSAQHRMRIGNCLVQLQRLHYSRSTLGKIFRWRFAGPIQSHINIAESRISHRVLWIEGGLMKILDAFVYSLRIQLVHVEVRLEESRIRLLILRIPSLFVGARRHQAGPRSSRY